MRPTATTSLAAHLGESTGQTSYHLPQLARHGLIEEVPDRGTGRERWWRPRSFSIDLSTVRDDPAATQAGRAISAALLDARTRALADWYGREEDHAAWEGMSLNTQSTLTLTPAETRAMVDALSAALKPFARLNLERHDGPVPADASRIRIYLDVFPLPSEAPET